MDELIDYIYELPLRTKVLCKLFAGDTTLHTHHANLDTLNILLQECIDDLVEWTAMNRMALHSDKSDKKVPPFECPIAA